MSKYIKIYCICQMLFILSMNTACNNIGVQQWSQNKHLFNVYATKFLEQSKITEIFRSSKNIYGFTTIEGYMVDIDFDKKVYQLTRKGKCNTKEYKSLNELLLSINYNSAELFYWINVLNKLNTYLISLEELPGRCVHISVYNKPPFNSTCGWFYIPNDSNGKQFLTENAETGRKRANHYFRDIMKLDDDWYYGKTRRN